MGMIGCTWPSTSTPHPISALTHCTAVMLERQDTTAYESPLAARPLTRQQSAMPLHNPSPNARRKKRANAVFVTVHGMSSRTSFQAMNHPPVSNWRGRRLSMKAFRSAVDTGGRVTNMSSPSTAVLAPAMLTTAMRSNAGWSTGQWPPAGGTAARCSVCPGQQPCRRLHRLLPTKVGEVAGAPPGRGTSLCIAFRLHCMWLLPLHLNRWW